MPRKGDVKSAWSRAWPWLLAALFYSALALVQTWPLVTRIGSVLPNGYAQVTPRGGTMVFDDEHIALWERGKGSTSANLHDGTPLTVYFRKPQLREEGVLPKGGIARRPCTTT